jgi:DNA replication and repair protein RecF
MLQSLLLRDFRCFTQAELQLHPQTTLLIGRNAVGKTSLLEAACMLLRLQSPRTTARTEMIHEGGGTAMIQGQWQDSSLRHAFNHTTRRLALNGAACSRGEDYLRQSGVVIWMDHADMNLLRGGAEHRRRFLDFAASQLSADYLHALRGYEKALRSRNYVLKRDAQIQWRQADAYAQVMETYHKVLRYHRTQLLSSLPSLAAPVLTELSGGSEIITLVDQPGAETDQLAEHLHQLREVEERSRSTAAGAHRDDFQILLNGRDAQVFASEGQQRSLSLALKCAQAQIVGAGRSMAPLLLLDDVFGELDSHRRRALLRSLPADSQRVITTTHIDWAGELGTDFSVIDVEQLRV